MNLEELKFLEVIIILGPDPDGIIVAGADESVVINPFDTFDVVGMAFEDIFALIFVGSRIEAPNPDIFIATAGGDLFVSLVPVDEFYLF